MDKSIEEIIGFLDKNQDKLEITYEALESNLQRVFSSLNETPISSSEDWFLDIIENPICAAALGMPTGGELGKQLRYLLSSSSGFSHEMEKQISHRLHDIIMIFDWIYGHSLCPEWIKSYNRFFCGLKTQLESEGYCKITKSNDNDKEEFKKSWDTHKWERYHLTVSADPLWLLPNLSYFNSTSAQGIESKVFKITDTDVKILFDKFRDKLDSSINDKDESLFIDLSKLLWCIDTFLINIKLIENDQKNQKILGSLIKVLEDKVIKSIKLDEVIDEESDAKINENIDDACLLSKDDIKRMAIPEIYETLDRTLLFSAGWAFELLLLLKSIHKGYYAGDKSLDKILQENKLEIILNSLVKRGINHAISSGPSNHLFLVCQKLWFLLECWHFKSIAISYKYFASESDYFKRVENSSKFEPVENITKFGEYYYDNSLINRIYSVEEHLNEDQEIEENDNEKLKNNLYYYLYKICGLEKISGTKYSIFLLGGAGIGKTCLVSKTIQYLVKDMGKEEDCLRVTPLQVSSPEELFYKIESRLKEEINGKFEKNTDKLLILFFDEIHLQTTRYSPFAIMLDPLQEYQLGEHYLGDIQKLGDKQTKIPYKILYIFASSSYKSKEHFESIAREKNDIAMRDFATRVRHWIKLPELWQIPGHKYVLGYFLYKNLLKEVNIDDNDLKKVATSITLNGRLKSTREIEQELEIYKKSGNINNKYDEILIKNLRGDVINLFK